MDEVDVRGFAAQLANLDVEGRNLVVEPIHKPPVGVAQSAVDGSGQDKADVDPFNLWPGGADGVDQFSEAPHASLGTIFGQVVCPEVQDQRADRLRDVIQKLQHVREVAAVVCDESRGVG